MRTLAHALPAPIMSVAILVLWLLLAPGLAFGHVLLGAACAVVIPLLTRRFWPGRPPRFVRPWRAVRLLGVLLADIVVANLTVARRVVGPLDRLHPAFVEVPLSIEDDFVAVILGAIVSLTPGTVSVDIDSKRKVLLVHALDVTEADALSTRIKARYEAALKEIFGC